MYMFLYFDYYTGNPVLVSSDGMRDSFCVQSKSNCCISSFVQPDKPISSCFSF